MKNNNIKLKLYNLYNEILENQILNYKKLVKENNSLYVESKILLNNAHNSIENSIKLLEDNNFVDSLCLLRCSFESILFALTLKFDKKTYNVYKCKNTYNYKKILKLKHEKIKEKNPNHKIPDFDKIKKDYLSPSRMRNIVSNNYKVIFKEFFGNYNNSDEVNKELSAFYRYLCDFTHPSIIKTYIYEIQNDYRNFNCIKILLRLNILYCQMLLIISLNYLSTQADITSLCDLYAIIFILNMNLIDDLDNLKKILKEYEELLYLKLTRNYLMANKEKIEEFKKEISEIKNIKDADKKLADLLGSIIVKFNAESILKKYFA